MRQGKGSGVDMSYNGPQVSMIRNPLRGGSVPYEEWMDYASCQSLPAEHFELSDHLMDTSGEAPEEQHRLISLGLRVCNDCPAKRSCLVNSNEDDRRWTTRGGQPPEGLFKNPGGGSRRAEPIIRNRTCKKNHDSWAKRANGDFYCLTCKRLSEGGRVRPPRKRNRQPKAV